MWQEAANSLDLGVPRCWLVRAATGLLIFCPNPVGLWPSLAGLLSMKSYAPAFLYARILSRCLCVLFSRPYYPVAPSGCLYWMIGTVTWATTGTTFIVVALVAVPGYRGLLPPLIEARSETLPPPMLAWSM